MIVRMIRKPALLALATLLSVPFLAAWALPGRTPGGAAGRVDQASAPAPARSGTVISKDGTPIAYERRGEGPPLILVAGAFGYRALGFDKPFVELLAPDFTVYVFDRRGRGESGDAPTYAPEREVEDIQAIVEEAGGSAYVFGISSGAVLAAKAAAATPGIERLVLYEPPIIGADGPRFLADLREMLAEGRRGDMVEYFMVDVVGGRPEDVRGARSSPMWPLLESVAHTTIYDISILGDFRVPPEAADIAIPTLVGAGGASPVVMQYAAREMAEAIPGAEFRILEGQNHQVSPDAMAAVLREFLLANTPVR